MACIRQTGILRRSVIWMRDIVQPGCKFMRGGFDSLKIRRWQWRAKCCVCRRKSRRRIKPGVNLAHLALKDRLRIFRMKGTAQAFLQRGGTIGLRWGGLCGKSRLNPVPGGTGHFDDRAVALARFGTGPRLGLAENCRNRIIARLQAFAIDQPRQFCQRIILRRARGRVRPAQTPLELLEIDYRVLEACTFNHLKPR